MNGFFAIFFLLFRIISFKFHWKDYFRWNNQPENHSNLFISEWNHFLSLSLHHNLIRFRVNHTQSIWNTVHTSKVNATLCALCDRCCRHTKRLLLIENINKPYSSSNKVWIGVRCESRGCVSCQSQLKSSTMKFECIDGKQLVNAAANTCWAASPTLIKRLNMYLRSSKSSLT